MAERRSSAHAKPQNIGQTSFFAPEPRQCHAQGVAPPAVASNAPPPEWAPPQLVPATQVHPPASAPDTSYPFFELERRLRLFLDRALGELGAFTVTRVNAVRDRTDERIGALEHRLFERLSALEGAYVQQEQRMTRRVEAVAREMTEAVARTVANGLVAQGHALTHLAAPPSSAPEMPEANSRDIKQQLDKQERAFGSLQRTIDLAVAELDKKIQTLGMIFVAVPKEMRARDARVVQAMSALESEVKERLKRSDELFAQMAKTVNVARDEAHSGKEELASLLHETHADHLERFSTATNELQELKEATRNVKSPDDAKDAVKLCCLSEQLSELRADIQEMKQARNQVTPDNLLSKIETMMLSMILPSQSPSSVEKCTADASVVTDTDKYGSERSVEMITVHGSLVKTSRSDEIAQSLSVITNAEDFQFGEEHLFESVSATTLINDMTPSVDSQTKDRELFDETPVMSRSSSTFNLTPTRIINAPEDGSIYTLGNDSVHSREISSNSEGSNVPLTTCIYARSEENIADERYAEAIAGKQLLNASPAPSLHTAKWSEVCEQLDPARSPSPLTSVDSSDEHDESAIDQLEDTKPTPALGRPLRRFSRFSKTVAFNPERKFACPQGCGASYKRKKNVADHLNRSRCGIIHRQGSNNSTKKRLRLHGSRIPRVTLKLRKRQDEEGPRKRIKLVHDTQARSSSSASESRQSRTQNANSLMSNGSSFSNTLQISSAWPNKTFEDEAFDRLMIQCDRCDSFYHYRCSGVMRGDRRLDEDAPFICTPCSLNKGSSLEQKTANDSCTRPDCDWVGEMLNQDYFVIEKIVGRMFTCDLTDDLKKSRWLIKWQGFGIPDCTWVMISDIPDASSLIPAFLLTAAKEQKDSRDSLIFLDEVEITKAKDEGWAWTSEC